LALIAGVGLGLLTLRTVLVWGAPSRPRDATLEEFADVMGPEPAISPDEIWTEESDPAPLAEPAPTLELAVPVLGVGAEELRGSFAEARGLGRRHRAIDIPAPRGTPVVAAAAGRIARLLRGGNAGVAIVQVSGAGQTGAPGAYAYLYAHLDGYARGLAEGQTVERGQLLGYVGTTGNAPPSVPHLHFEVRHLDDSGRWWSGTPVDPLPLLQPRLAAAPPAGPQPSK
jgi:murein DD-endopeptidase MepM/ murein hydrolase activator NlpD